MDAAGADDDIERNGFFWYIYGTLGSLLDSEYVRFTGTNMNIRLC